MNNEYNDSLVKGLGNISFFRYHKLALSSLSQKRTEHGIQQAEIPWNIDKNLYPEKKEKEKKNIFIFSWRIIQ